jgi:hypothetical protein
MPDLHHEALTDASKLREDIGWFGHMFHVWRKTKYRGSFAEKVMRLISR